MLAAHPLAPLVSLHHLDTIQTLFPALNQHDSLKKLVSAYEMDPGRTVQHSFCYDLRRNWSISVSWGYAVELYPLLLTAKQLETTPLTFQTWKSMSSEPFTFNTRTVGPAPCEKPVVFFLDRVDQSVDPGSRTLTSYKRFVDDLESECDRDDYAGPLAIRRVNVSAAHFDSGLWNKVRVTLFNHQLAKAKHSMFHFILHLLNFMFVHVHGYQSLITLNFSFVEN